MSEQLTHNQTQFNHQNFPITIISDHLYFQENIGSLFRIAEAYGVEKIILLGKNIPFVDRKINKTSRSTHRIVPFELVEDTQIVCELIQQNQAQVLALEITDDSILLTELQVTNQPIYLLIGSEVNGIQQSLLDLANQKVHIEMYGKNSSMNVIQATAIMLFQLTNLIKK
ncbi:TrmH family RNA methyltransferase [Flavobacterium agricola]|uniref:TrmH family RNA methyltransferase n=1 Tax=Flavobacterium agricola TaxID=2870839 RepID=A0ABY6M0J6_9FLAO|nr:TrmH family RNA methyltransferase [Flavobacterium agricola]UYW02073.1 TrmH family RNA methyltransferase [Flavobacterium agricola]